jgi:hypothetical protein
MKTFLMIIGAILVIAGLSIFWAYSSFKYQPDYFEAIEDVNISRIAREGRKVESRILEDLAEKGETRISGDDMTALVINQISRRGKVNLKSFVKKVKSEVVDGRLKVEALVNLKELSQQKMPAKAKEYLDMFLENTPDDLLEDVYISFNGLPVRDGSILKFDENTEFTIGDISYNLSSVYGSHKIRIGASMLRKLGISNFEVLDDMILLQK